MRFKATLLNEKISLFSRIINSLMKNSKDCVLHLAPLRVQFIISSEATESGVQIWSGIPTNELFETVTLESFNNNEVAFDINMDHLSRALKSAQSASEITLKLAKKATLPYLSVIVAPQTNTIAVIQDIPIMILSAQQLGNYVEPQLPDPDVHIMMPTLKSLRNVIDKMKNHSEYIDIRANMSGDLNFSIETENVTIKTFYRGLEHPMIEGRSPPQENPDQTAAVKVDIKKFSKFLFSYQVQPSNVILCIVEDRAIVLHVLLDNLYLTYYIPVITGGLDK